MSGPSNALISANEETETVTKLTNDEISRYSRQIILPELGMNGQLKLKQSSVLIVGIGGLGCPAAMYICSAGIGTVGLIDYDVVELSNLHRQILHNEKTLNMSKAESAKLFLQNLNSNINIVTFQEPFTSKNALEIVQKFDIVLDCTDNVATRYLLNDVCVLTKKPLVSGSALRFEGQLTIYNLDDAPCYRCLFPKPPPPEFVTNCSDGGVLGAIPGLIGTLQALEAIKYLSGIGTSYVGKMLLFDGLNGKFSTITLRPKQANCTICSETNTSKQTKLLDDYPSFCGSCSIDDKDKPLVLLQEQDRITPTEYNELLTSSKDSSKTPVLIDVREPQEVEICSLPNTTLNIPYSLMSKRKETMDELHNFLTQRSSDLQNQSGEMTKLSVYIVCRRGNDSQRATKLIREQWPDLPIAVKDIKGGLHQWSREVDISFPIY